MHCATSMITTIAFPRPVSSRKRPTALSCRASYAIWPIESDSIDLNGRIFTHADPYVHDPRDIPQTAHRQREGYVGARLYGNDYMFRALAVSEGDWRVSAHADARWPIRPILGFRGIEQSSPKWEISCPGRRWTTVQHSVPKVFIVTPIDVLCSNYVKCCRREIGEIVRSYQTNDFAWLSSCHYWADRGQ